jgi:PhzF family phenazine biosynthesis protein
MGKTIKVIQVDAFTDKLFGGNPACVCVLEAWLDDNLMQEIASENNLSETAFIVNEENGYRIRWFTPAIEVDLCGHATLASAHVFYNHRGYSKEEIIFNSKSGPLKISKAGEYFKLDFPTDKINQVKEQKELESALNINAVETYKGKTDFLCILGSEKEVKECKPDFGALKKMKVRGVIISAKGDNVDFVSRFFAPGSGVDEDPVTGSAHTSLTPFWSNHLNKTRMEARQISKRGGHLFCEYHGERVFLFGKAITYSTGTIFLD